MFIGFSNIVVIVGFDKSSFSVVVGRRFYWVGLIFLRNFVVIRSKDMSSS